MTELVAGDPLPDLGEHQVGQAMQVPVVDDHRRVRQQLTQRPGERRRRVDRHDLDPVPERLALQGEPAPHRCPRSAGCQSEQAAGMGRVEVNEAGHPRIGPAPPASDSSQRTDLARVSSTPSIRTPVGAGPQTRAATATSAWLTLHHDTPYSRATSLAARRDPDTARSS